MTREERLAYSKKMNSVGVGLIASDVGTLVGLTNGLWASMGGGAIGVGFGSASSLLFSSYGPFDAGLRTHLPPSL